MTAIPTREAQAVADLAALAVLAFFDAAALAVFVVLAARAAVFR
jgi:hypothetical protein